MAFIAFKPAQLLHFVRNLVRFAAPEVLDVSIIISRDF
jgi:hypothetical protein